MVLDIRQGLVFLVYRLWVIFGEFSNQFSLCLSWLIELLIYDSFYSFFVCICLLVCMFIFGSAYSSLHLSFFYSFMCLFIYLFVSWRVCHISLFINLDFVDNRSQRDTWIHAIVFLFTIHSLSVSVFISVSLSLSLLSYLSGKACIKTSLNIAGVTLFPTHVLRSHTHTRN